MVCDNLNRATSVGGVSCTNDILGNRLSKGTATYGWDVLNRMTSYQTTSPVVGSSYVYRADGMRTSKTIAGWTTLYRYDGQMGMHDVETDANSVWQKTTDYALGARGVDAISTTTSSGTTVAYPIYDAHGNMISTLSKSGTNAYTFTAVRTFDAWGVIRRGAASGEPKGRYCANLGHKQDDESGLVYMRARYYEPSSGRFVSEDPARDGANWFIYAGNSPTKNADLTGKAKGDTAALMFLLVGIITAIACLAMSPIAGVGISIVLSLIGYGYSKWQNLLSEQTVKILESEIAALQSDADRAAEESLAGPAIDASAKHVGEIEGAIIEMEIEESVGGGGGLYGEFWG